MDKQSGASELDKVTSAMMYYFIVSLNGVLGRTHLQKLLFLSDLLASKKYKAPLTKLNYVRYNHGPYSKSLNDYIDSLVKDELIEERKFPMFSDPVKHYSRFYQKKIIKAKDYLINTIGPDKMLLIDEVSQSYGNISLQKVLDFVYSLEEVKDAPFDSPIKLATDIKSSTEDEDDMPF